MRKILSLALAVLMLCSLCTTGFAATINETGGQSANTTVTYGVEMSYIVTVPDSVVIDAEELTGSATVTASNVMLSAGYQLNVTLNSDFTLTDASNANNTLGYTVKNNGVAVASGDVVLFVESGDTDGASTILALNLNSEPTKAGAYSDVITFGVGVSTNINEVYTVSGVWVFNNMLTPSPDFTCEGLTLSFESNGNNYKCLWEDGWWEGEESQHNYNYILYGLITAEEVVNGNGNDETLILVYDDGWVNESYRIIDFGAEPQEVSEDFYTWFTANATKQEEMNLITFSINGVPYQAAEGMTWREYIESDLNTGEFHYQETVIYVLWDIVYWDEASYGTPITAEKASIDSEIVANHDYYAC